MRYLKKKNPMNKIKILMIDDDELIRLYFKDIFWIHGLEGKYEITTAKGPEEAEKILENPETKPDIVFLDLIMPGSGKGNMEASWQTGLGLLKRIKEDKKLEGVKVIIYSSLNDGFIKRQIKKYGAEMHIVKGENLPKEIIDLTEKITQKK